MFSALILAALSAQAVAAATDSVGPNIATCDHAIAGLIAGAPNSVVPITCWRVGPLQLGMSRAEVERIAGPPVQTTPVGDGLYQAEIFAFPRAWRAKLNARPASDLNLRFVEVLFQDGRAVAVANDPAIRVKGSSCRPGEARPNVHFEGDPADFSPFETFAGVRVGAKVSELKRLFGREPNANRPRDWRSYLPTPIAFDADPDRGRITGFAIGADESAVTAQARVEITVSRDAATCRITAISFGDRPAEGRP